MLKTEVLDYLSKILKKEFVKNLSYLQASHFAVMGAQFASSLLMARVLGPELLGLYALVYSVFGFTMAFFKLNLRQTALVKLAGAFNSNDKEKGLEALSFLIGSGIIVYGVACIVGLTIVPLLTNRIYSGSFGHIVALLFLPLPLSPFGSLYSLMLESSGHFRALSVWESLTGILRPIVILLVAFLTASVFHMVLCAVSYDILISCLGLIKYIDNRKRQPFYPEVQRIIKSLNVKKIFNREYVNFSIALSVSKNISTLQETILILAVGKLYPLEQVGFFKLAKSLASLVGFFGSPLSRAALISFTKTKDSRRLIKKYVTMAGMSFFFVLASAGILLAGWDYLLKVLGGKYSSLPLSYLALFLLFYLISSVTIPLGALQKRINIVDVMAKVHVVYFIVYLVCILIAYLLTSTILDFLVLYNVYAIVVVPTSIAIVLYYLTRKGTCTATTGSKAASD